MRGDRFSNELGLGFVLMPPLRSPAQFSRRAPPAPPHSRGAGSDARGSVRSRDRFVFDRPYAGPPRCDYNPEFV